MTVTLSVVIPTYNRAPLLPRAIRSVLAEADAEVEIVVVDDGSTDDTAAVVGGFDDARVRYQRQTNAGVSAARNAGAASATGEFLLFLDSDDELLPGAFASFRTALATDDWQVVLAGWIRVAPGLREWRTFLPTRAAGREHLHGPYLPGAFVIAKPVFVAAGGYDEQLRFSENTVLGWRVREVLVATGASIGLIGAPLVVRYSPPDRPFDQARYEASVRILERYGDALENPATAAGDPRKRRSNFLAVAGTNAAALGRRREAWRYSVAAIKNDPKSGARYRGLLGVARATLRPERPKRAVDVPESAPGALTPVHEASVQEAQSDGAVYHLYVPTEGVAGSAIAAQLATGFERTLAVASDDDWMLVTVGGSEPPPSDVDALREFAAWLLERGAPVGAVGFGGRYFDRRRGRLRAPTREENAGPATVDELGCDGSVMIRVAAARAVGGFDRELCIGFTALEYGLRLAKRGYALYSVGPPWSAPAQPAATAHRSEPPELSELSDPWVRYHEVRNLVVITRRYGSARAALAVSARALFVPRGDPRGWFASSRTAGRACRDAWSGNLGCSHEHARARERRDPPIQNW